MTDGPNPKQRGSLLSFDEQVQRVANVYVWSGILHIHRLALHGDHCQQSRREKVLVPPSDAHQRGKDADEAFSGAPRHLSDTSGAEGQNTRLPLTPTPLQHTHTEPP